MEPQQNITDAAQWSMVDIDEMGQAKEAFHSVDAQHRP
jgi:hypothetical protein